MTDLELAAQCESEACYLARLLNERHGISSDLPQHSELRRRAADLAIISQVLRTRAGSDSGDAK